MDEKLTDLAACRVLLYRPEEQTFVVRAIEGALKFVPGSSKSKDNAKTGYRAHHIDVEASDPTASVPLMPTICEVQVTTVGAHIFNEVEHDISYKTHGIEPAPAMDGMLATLASQCVAVETCANAILAQHDRTIAETHAEAIDVQVLRAYVFARTGRLVHGDFNALLTLLDKLRGVSPALGGPNGRFALTKLDSALTDSRLKQQHATVETVIDLVQQAFSEEWNKASPPGLDKASPRSQMLESDRAAAQKGDKNG